MNRSTMTFQGSARDTVPRMRRTSRASSQYMRAMAFLALLLQGMATSTCCTGASTSQKAITGMFMYDDSNTGWESVTGSVTN